MLETADFKLYASRANERRSHKNLPSLLVNIRHITHREKHHGADLGLVARLLIPNEVVLTKAAIVQGKRLHPRFGSFDKLCEYEELFATRNSIPPQWERMLNISPSSAYFLYNPEHVR